MSSLVSGDRVFNALGEHDLAHGLPLRQTQRTRRLGLAGVDGLDAAAQDLHHVGGGVKRDGDEAGGKGAPNLVGLGGLEAHAAQDGKARVIDEQALDHHGRAAHDGGVDGRKASADALEETHQIVIHAVERLNAQEHKEQRQEEGDDRAEGRKRDGDLDAANKEVAALIGHVDQARQKVAGVGVRDDAHLHQVDKRHDAAVDKEDRCDGNDNVAAQARAATEALGSKRRFFAIVIPMHELGDERRRRHDDPSPQNRPEAILEDARGRQKAQRRGVALAKRQAKRRDNARAQIYIAMVGLDKGGETIDGFHAASLCRLTVEARVPHLVALLLADALEGLVDHLEQLL